MNSFGGRFCSRGNCVWQLFDRQSYYWIDWPTFNPSLAFSKRESREEEDRTRNPRNYFPIWFPRANVKVADLERNACATERTFFCLCVCSCAGEWSSVSFIQRRNWCSPRLWALRVLLYFVHFTLYKVWFPLDFYLPLTMALRDFLDAGGCFCFFSDFVVNVLAVA